MELKKPSKIKVPKQARSQKKVDQILQSDLRELSEQSKGQLPSMRKILKKNTAVMKIPLRTEWVLFLLVILEEKKLVFHKRIWQIL